MKKILFIGKFNEITKDLHNYLLRYFQVQLCSDQPDIVEGMLKINTPDLVLISMIGFGAEHKDIYVKLTTQYSDVPVISVGTESELFSFIVYYSTSQFSHLRRPIGNPEVVKEICDRLDMDYDILIMDAQKQKQNKKKMEKKHILLVDDNPMILRNMKNMLSSKYEISLATSGVQAIKMIGKKRPDLIFLDYEMPVCNGKMTLEMIRSDEEMKDIPVIFVTAIADKDYIEAVLRLNPAGYFLKPPVQSKILAAVESVLEPA